MNWDRTIYFLMHGLSFEETSQPGAGASLKQNKNLGIYGSGSADMAQFTSLFTGLLFNRSTANWALRNKVCNGHPFFQGTWVLWYWLLSKKTKFKTFVWLSRFRNCLGKVRSSNSDRDIAKRVIAIAHWSPMRDHSSRAVKVDAQITQFRSELSRMWCL